MTDPLKRIDVLLTFKAPASEDDDDFGERVLCAVTEGPAFSLDEDGDLILARPVPEPATPELTQDEIDAIHEAELRGYGMKPVAPEPATKPCATCDGMGDVAVAFGETPLDYTTAPCSACGGSGVAKEPGDAD